MSWLGHAGFMLRFGEKVAYIDPWQMGRTRPDADYVFITHNHYDHLSVEDIDTVVKDSTVIIAPEDCRGKLEPIRGTFRSVSRGQKVELPDLSVEVVAAYNKDKKFHPDASGWVGYVIEIDGKRLYFAGDTDNIDEMKGIVADVAMLPVSGTYVMTAKEAAAALKKMKVKKAVPMHYGAIVGDENDAKEFKKLAPKGVSVTILEKE